MKKEKESGTLLGIGTAYLPVKEIKGEFYVKVSDFTRCMDGIRIEQEADRKHIEELEEENKKLKEEIENHKQNIMQDELEIIPKLEEENRKLKEKVRFLEECLDRKEKLNEEYRKELEDLKSTYVYDAKQVRDIC